MPRRPPYGSPPDRPQCRDSPQYGCRSVKNSMRPHKWAMKHCRCYEFGIVDRPRWREAVGFGLVDHRRSGRERLTYKP